MASMDSGERQQSACFRESCPRPLFRCSAWATMWRKLYAEAGTLNPRCTDNFWRFRVIHLVEIGLPLRSVKTSLSILIRSEVVYRCGDSPYLR